VSGQVIMYADRTTDAIRICLEETKRRRDLQGRYNEKYHITPESIKKSINNILASIYEADYVTIPAQKEEGEITLTEEELPDMIRRLKLQMQEAAKELAFERAAALRDQIKELSALMLRLGGADQ
jgi:excinuclease ABC subunit B